MSKKTHKKILLGLKVRQLRTERGWNFEEMHKRSKISMSYLNEIEKGRKYPQPANLQKLADAFDVELEVLLNPRLSKQFAPIADLLDSNFLNELPLDLFGIKLQQIVDIMARAPEQVNAFISALLEIARNYSLREENFYRAALRAYQEMNLNYFDDIEKSVDKFLRENDLNKNKPIEKGDLVHILKEKYGYSIDFDGLDDEPSLSNFRSVFLEKNKTLLLNGQLNDRQTTYQLAKEIGFNALQLKDRPYASTIVKVKSFAEVLNNYLGAYFGVALLINRQAFAEDLRSFFGHHRWQGEHLLRLMEKYRVSPEVLFQRFALLTQNFDLRGMFFFRFIHDTTTDKFEIDKELHLNRKHRPHASGLNEHYCRRWITLKLLNKLQESEEDVTFMADAQLAHLQETGEDYLLLSIVKKAHPSRDKHIGILLSIEMDEVLKSTVKFLNDPNLDKAVVNVTCETCSILDCAERVSPPSTVQKKQARKEILDALERLK